MLKTANASFMLGTSSWREQFMEALTVSAGDDDDDDDDEEGEEGDEEPGEGDGLKPKTAKEPKEPSKSDYFMHFLSVPWKLAFATIPPTGQFMI
jgi:solute carrier family 8 (sodium/calcium exchanger)